MKFYMFLRNAKMVVSADTVVGDSINHLSYHPPPFWHPPSLQHSTKYIRFSSSYFTHISPWIIPLSVKLNE